MLVRHTTLLGPTAAVSDRHTLPLSQSVDWHEAQLSFPCCFRLRPVSTTPSVSVHGFFRRY